MEDNQNKETILLTGFGPFAGHPKNPSWLVVQKLSEEWNNEVDLHIEEIPVEYKYVEENVPKLWKEIKPKLAIHVGVSSLAQDELQIESCAHSFKYNKIDVAGCTGPQCSVEECLNTKLCIDRLLTDCNASSVMTVNRSDDAGRYLCEFVYYTSLKVDQGQTLFVHIPVLDEKNTLEKVTKTLEVVLSCCLKQIK